MSTGVRDSVAAGSLYPEDSSVLRSEIDNAINSADADFVGPKVLVLPSCGLSAAADVAATGLVMLESERGVIERVIVVGDHSPGVGERPFSGIAMPQAIAFRTPLGDLLVDRESIDSAASHPSVHVSDRPFRNDTSIEVHLPPIQRLLGSVRVVPVLVGDVAVTDLVDVFEHLWGDRSTLIIVTTSFGHGTDIDQAAAQGERARDVLEKNDRSALEQSSASSRLSLAALGAVIARRSMGLLELASDTVSDPFTGTGALDVGAFAAWESTGIDLDEADREHLRALVGQTVALTVLGGRVSGADLARVPPALTARRATVVTLRHAGKVRGSAGTIEADRSFAGSVVRNAAAACADPRLPSIQPAELSDLRATVTVISPIERIFPHSWDDLIASVTPNVDGLLVTQPGSRAAQLPAMWSRFSSTSEFVGAVARKARLDSGSKVSQAAWYRFQSVDY